MASRSPEKLLHSRLHSASRAPARIVRRLALASLLVLLAALGVVGCAQEESVIVLQVVSPEDLGELTITVISLDGLAAPDPMTLAVNRSAVQIRERPIPVELRLGGPREVMVVLSATGASMARLVAHRCFAVAGAVRESVWLVPLGSTEDADGDGFPRRAIAACARPDARRTSPVSCAGDDPVLCAAMGESDCDDDAASRYPGALDVCGNALDENCDGEDEPCSP